MLIKALIVEFIQRLWLKGLFVGWKPAVAIRDAFLAEWVEWRAQITMKAVDKQAKEMTPPPAVEEPEFTEEKEGETELGGEMRLKAPWLTDNKAT